MTDRRCSEAFHARAQLFMADAKCAVLRRDTVAARRLFLRAATEESLARESAAQEGRPRWAAILLVYEAALRLKGNEDPRWLRRAADANENFPPSQRKRLAVIFAKAEAIAERRKQRTKTSA